MTESTSTGTGNEVETVTSEDGTEIAFERTGGGPPLVLVHGAVCDHTFWELSDVRAALAEHYTVHAMDCRGVGWSGDAPEYELEREFEDVAAVVDAVDRSVALLGHSGGALLSLEAARRTDNLDGLVLYEPPIFDVIPETALAEMQELVDDGENERMIEFFLREVAQSTPEEIAAQRTAPYWRAVVDAAPVWLRHFEAGADYEFDAARFAEMTTPTALLTGSESPRFLKDATTALHDALPNSRIVTFDGYAHEAMLTAPDLFVDEVRTFIRESS